MFVSGLICLAIAANHVSVNKAVNIALTINFLKRDTGITNMFCWSI